MSGVFPNLQLNNDDLDAFHDKSISPIDIPSMKFSDEDWLTTKQDIIIKHEEKPKRRSSILDQEIPKLRHRTLGPEPLLPNKFHPLCYCYRLPEDFDHYPPRIYCIGEPEDDDIVIYSDRENITWKAFKESKPNVQNLNKIFPFVQLKKHEEEKEEHSRYLAKSENKAAKEIDFIKKSCEWEKNRLEVFFQNEIEEINKIKLKLNRNPPNLKGPTDVNKKESDSNKRDNRTQQKRNNLKSTTSLSTPSLDRNSLSPRMKSLGKAYSLSDENVRDKVRKIKPILPSYTLQERLHYERYGCTQKEFEEREWQEKKMKAGVWF